MKLLNSLLKKINEKLYAAVISKNIKDLREEVNKINYQLIDLFGMGEHDQVLEMLEKYRKWVNASAGIFETEEEMAAYQMGMLSGTVAAVDQLCQMNNQIREYEMAHLGTKYQEQIIEQLIGTEYISHNQLAQKLQISPSQLTVMMSKLEGTKQNIISASRNGKFKYYCLTDFGKRYYNYQHKGNLREEIMLLLSCVMQKCRSKERNIIKSFVDRYYVNDLKLKQMAMEVEDSIEKLKNGQMNFMVSYANTCSLDGKKRSAQWGSLTEMDVKASPSIKLSMYQEEKMEGLSNQERDAVYEL